MKKVEARLVEKNTKSEEVRKEKREGDGGSPKNRE